LQTRSLVGVRPRPVEFLVEGYIPLDKVVLFGGQAGLGKSATTLDLTAAVTVGRCAFGLTYTPPPPADVLLCFAEDDTEDTVVPRLVSFGADLNRVHEVQGVASKGGVLPFSLAACDILEDELKRRPNVRLVVIDPVGVFVGRTNIDSHKEAPVQALMAALRDVAMRRRVTVLLVALPNKNEDAKACNRISGSAAFVTSARAVFLFAEGRDQEAGQRLILPVKYNCGPMPLGLVYSTRELTPDELIPVLPLLDHLGDVQRDKLIGQLFRVAWHGTTTTTADDVWGKKHEPNKAGLCAEWMRQFLAQYAYPSDEIEKAAYGQKFTLDHVKRAKAKLKEEGLCGKKDGFQGRWWNGFGDPATWQRRPDPAVSPTTPSTPHTNICPPTPQSGNNAGPKGAASGGAAPFAPFAPFGAPASLDSSQAGSPKGAKGPKGAAPPEAAPFGAGSPKTAKSPKGAAPPEAAPFGSAWLAAFLAGDGRPAEEVISAGAAAGRDRDQVIEMATAAGVEEYEEPPGRWCWRLPPRPNGAG
jgi:hypothetical protein